MRLPVFHFPDGKPDVRISQMHSLAKIASELGFLNRDDDGVRFQRSEDGTGIAWIAVDCGFCHGEGCHCCVGGKTKTTFIQSQDHYEEKCNKCGRITAFWTLNPDVDVKFESARCFSCGEHLSGFSFMKFFNGLRGS